MYLKAYSIFLFLRFYFYILLERGKENEKEGTQPATRACALTESNQGPFDSQTSTQSSESHQPGHVLHLNEAIC